MSFSSRNPTRPQPPPPQRRRDIFDLDGEPNDDVDDDHPLFDMLAARNTRPLSSERYERPPTQPPFPMPNVDGLSPLAALSGIGGAAGAAGGLGLLGTLLGTMGPHMGKIWKLIRFIMWIGRNIIPWICGFVSCYIALMLWYGPEGIMMYLLPYCGESVLMMVGTGCVIRLYDYFSLQYKIRSEVKIKNDILHRAPTLD
eukprot:NODE_7372_length_784_cov_35.959153_g6762_i0.p1 GENE.NODE_7372_length_784_cov_35.959153_g6762_i0~~NODE_7372_length_784_cov_35.959153_g6762_i0.p1  ORF type:complete len:199 (-),score=36.50 NODE_7372_length_784_cov_35.959153_g6762_i0:13-609(-)